VCGEAIVESAVGHGTRIRAWAPLQRMASRLSFPLSLAGASAIETRSPPEAGRTRDHPDDDKTDVGVDAVLSADVLPQAVVLPWR